MGLEDVGDNIDPHTLPSLELGLDLDDMGENIIDLDALPTDVALVKVVSTFSSVSSDEDSNSTSITCFRDI